MKATRWEEDETNIEVDKYLNNKFFSCRAMERI